MNNNTIQINSYLQNEMDAEERNKFEALLLIDKELQYELTVQQQIMQAAVHAGMKAEFAKAIKHQFVLRQLIKWGIITAITVTVILLVVYRQHIFTNKTISNKQETTVAKNITAATQPFINPPLKTADIPYSEYNFDAAKGDTIYYPSGSILCFPSNAFVDASGNIIKGIVNISYREFADPVDFLVSGIPMDYDSAGTKYNFESSGMCEVNAYQNSTAIFVNQQSQPQINLSSNNKSSLHNLYALDTVNRKWIFVGKDKITEVKSLAKSIQVATEAKGNTNGFDMADEKPIKIPAKPMKPIKATPGRQAFSIAIDPGAFQELLAYDKQQFEVADIDQANYNPSDADEHWDNVKLDKTSTQGIYLITFRNQRRTVSYKVRPVLSGDDYDAALEIFNEKNKAYEEAAQERITKYKAETDSIVSNNKRMLNKWNTENEANNKLNELIIARNKQFRKNQQLEKEAWAKQVKANEEAAKKLELLTQELWQQRMEAARVQQLIFEENQRKYATDINLSSEIIRTFSINRFGVWNCDHPQIPGREIEIIPIYTYNDNNAMYLPFASVVYKGFNGIIQFAAQTSIRVIPGSENMILSIKDGYLYYFPYKDFMSSGISYESQKFTFKMHRSEEMGSSYVDIKKMIDAL